MMQEIFQDIEKVNEEIEGDIFKLDHRLMTLDDFLRFFLKYFELDGDLKGKYNEAFDYPKTSKDYYEQKHRKLNFLRYMFDIIRPFFPLCYKIATTFNKEMLEKENLSDEGIIKIIDNFLHLYRSGRPRKFYSGKLKDFKKFKIKYEDVFAFLKETRKSKCKSLLDHQNLLISFNLNRKRLNIFLLEYGSFREAIRKAGKSTLYRYDKDMILIKREIHTIEFLMENWRVFDI